MAKTSFTTLNDCFIDSALMNQFKVNQAKKRKAGKSKGFTDRQHAINFKKMQDIYLGLEAYKSKPIPDLLDDPIEKSRISG